MNVEIKKEGAKHLLSFNFALAITNIRLYLRRIINEGQIIERIKKYLVPIRPDRSYPRHVRPQSQKAFNNRAA